MREAWLPLFAAALFVTAGARSFSAHHQGSHADRGPRTAADERTRPAESPAVAIVTLTTPAATPADPPLQIEFESADGAVRSSGPHSGRQLSARRVVRCELPWRPRRARLTAPGWCTPAGETEFAFAPRGSLQQALVRSRSCLVVVRDARHEPISGATIEGGPVTVSTKADGSAELTLAATADATLWIDADGYHGGAVRARPDGPAQLSVALGSVEASPPLVVEVVDPADEPVEGALVSWSWDFAAPVAPDLVAIAFRERWSDATQCRQRTAAEPLSIPVWEAGALEIRARHPDRGRAEPLRVARAKERAAAHESVRLTFAPAARLRVRTLAPGGRPESCIVGVGRVTEDGVEMLAQKRGDADGEVELWVPPAATLVIARSPEAAVAWRTLPEDFDGATIEFRLETGRTLEFCIAGSLDLEVETRKVALVEPESGLVLAWAAPDANERYRFEHAPTGFPLRLVRKFAAPGGQVLVESFELDREGGVETLGEFELRPGDGR